MSKPEPKRKYKKLLLSTPPWMLARLSQLAQPTDKNMQAVISRLIKEAK